MQIPVYEWKFAQENPVVPFRPPAKSTTTPRKVIQDPHYMSAIQNMMDITGASYEVAKKAVDHFMSQMAKGSRKSAPAGRVIPFQSNPRMTKIYNRCIKIFASKAGMTHRCDAQCRKAGHNYVHAFKKKSCIYGLPDGSILIK